jgi:hypothetical protein
MARINASLLVLGGVGVGRVRRENVALAKVMMAAVSQIEFYTRVRLGVIDADVAVVPEAVDDVVHLLAELMDNATSYSPPDTDVWATARALGDRVIIQISDEGVGLPPNRLAQLNVLLARPPAVDVAAVRAMGLTVVGQLGARLGASVELRPGPRLGTIAELTLPATLLRRVPPEEQLAAIVGAAALPQPAPVGMLTDPRLAHGSSSNGNGREALPKRPQLAAVRSESDRTRELPIFQQVSTWFRAGEGEEDSSSWQSPADDGWRTASELAEPQVASTTRSGLPLRTPKRHLIPGGVNVPTQRQPDRRDPTQVAVAMAAYARGVAGRRLRLNHAPNDPTGVQS